MENELSPERHLQVSRASDLWLDPEAVHQLSAYMVAFDVSSVPVYPEQTRAGTSAETQSYFAWERARYDDRFEAVTAADSVFVDKTRSIR